jgi:hypothetical protein
VLADGWEIQLIPAFHDSLKKLASVLLLFFKMITWQLYLYLTVRALLLGFKTTGHDDILQDGVKPGFIFTIVYSLKNRISKL